MTNISKELGLIINLHNTAVHHKETCIKEDCNVSVFQLKETAKLLCEHLSDKELIEAIRLITVMPIT